MLLKGYFQPETRKMQNAEWPGDAGADQWNICVGHSNGLLIPPQVNCKFVHPAGDSHSLAISGFGNGDEISTCVILLSGSRLASSSTSCLGSVRVLRNKILEILPLTLILLRL